MALFFFDAGTAGVLLPPRRAPKRRNGSLPGLPPADGSGGSGGGGGGDDGGSFGRGADGVGPFALGLALTGITTLFLVLIAVWLFLRRPASDWPLPGGTTVLRALWISTACLAASSVAVEFAARRARHGLTRRRDAGRWLVASLVFGLAFLASQLSLWSTLWSAGLVPASSGYAAVFFALTGLHALHVLGGLLYLSSLALALRAAGLERLPSVRLGATYWHFMGGIWFVLFTLLYFVR